KVARGLDRQVEATVLSELGEHVIEERQAGTHLGVAGTIDDEPNADRRLLGVALKTPCPRCAHASTSCKADKKASFSVGVPTVTRRQPSSRGQLAQLRTRTDLSTNSSHTLSP